MPPPHNLPLQLTSFIGREPQIAEVKRLLGTSRLLTLVGPGGSGKTRLALQVASDLLDVDQYPHGVWFVDLAPLSDPRLVPHTVAFALGIQEQPGRSVLDSLKDNLLPRELLLVLDNCEHLVEACSLLADTLLRACQDLRILATSRHVLGVAGEIVWRIPSLALPENHKQPPESLEQYEAVHLFTERARLKRPAFALTPQSAPAVAQICQTLDGMPLAIELAAARVAVLSVEQIAARLVEPLRLLRGGSRSSMPRQQTLEATIEWSYALLSEPERKLLRSLAVFAGGFTLEAVEDVNGVDTDEYETIDLLSQLVDKSLVVVEERRGEARYRLLETIREYARAKMRESGEAKGLARQHALYFAALVEEAKSHLYGTRHVEWLNRLEDEHDNVRAALKWAKECKGEGGDCGSEEAAEAEVIGLRIAVAFWSFWDVRGYFSEAREQFEAALAPTPPILESIQAVSSPPEQSPRVDEIATPTTVLTAEALYGAGALAGSQGDHGAARKYLEQSLEMSRTLGYLKGIADSLSGLGNVLSDEGDFSAAQSLFEQSLAIRRELGYKVGITRSLQELGLVASRQGHFSAARSLFEQGLALSREIGDEGSVAGFLTSLGHVACIQEDYPSARSLFDQGLELWSKAGDKDGIANSLGGVGFVGWMQSDYSTARSLLEHSLELHRELGDRRGVAVSLLGLGGVMAEMGYAGRGASLLGASEGILQAIGSVLGADRLALRKRAIDSTRARLSEEAFEKAWAEGRSLSMEQAIASALDAVPETEPITRAQSAPATAAKRKLSYPNDLSRREVEVLRLLTEGLTNQQIAERLFLTRNTVRAHVYSIYSKVGASNRAAATRFASEHRLL